MQLPSERSARHGARHARDFSRKAARFIAELGGFRATCYFSAMHLALTAVFRKVPEGYIAFVEELPGANTQAPTLDEARENLREAVQLVLEANRELAQEDASGEVIREELRIA